MSQIGSLATDQSRAQHLLKTYGGEVDDFFKLWPKDKKYFFTKNKTAFITYGISHKVAICLFDPNGKPQEIPRLIKEFKNYCYSHGLHIIFVQSTNTFHDAFIENNFHRLLIGADAIINTEKFTKETIHNKYFRNLVNRMHENGYKLKSYKPPHNPALLNELKVVSNDWLALPNHKEWFFLTGHFSIEYLQQTRLHVLRNHQDRILAFANEIPSFKQGISTIDLMRYSKKSSPHVMDFLFIQLLQKLYSQGILQFNMGISPLDADKFTSRSSEKILNQLFNTFQKFIGFRGLHQFKAKWQPTWEPRYVWYTGRLIFLPYIGFAILDLLTNKPKK